ncbi:hypothetical protein HZA56_05205 [Candidatus Poribacteria bacterium]|nr:hypothetical protein [Candidatus Poribacteria bacterium]
MREPGRGQKVLLMAAGALLAATGPAHATSAVSGEGDRGERSEGVNQEANYSRSFPRKTGKHYAGATGYPPDQLRNWI